jgi:hypothetical protein
MQHSHPCRRLAGVDSSQGTHVSGKCLTFRGQQAIMSIVRGVAQVEARGVWDAEVVGSSPITPTNAIGRKGLGGSSLVGKASAFQAEDREFESRLPLQT